MHVLGPSKIGDIRLSETSRGIPQIYFNNTWGSICVKSYSYPYQSSILNTICSQLGYTRGLAIFYHQPIIPITPMLQIYNCLSTSFSVGQCNTGDFNNVTDCLQKDTLYVICVPRKSGY